MRGFSTLRRFPVGYFRVKIAIVFTARSRIYRLSHLKRAMIGAITTTAMLDDKPRE